MTRNHKHLILYNLAYNFCRLGAVIFTNYISKDRFTLLSVCPSGTFEKGNRFCKQALTGHKCTASAAKMQIPALTVEHKYSQYRLSGDM